MLSAYAEYAAQNLSKTMIFANSCAYLVCTGTTELLQNKIALVFGFALTLVIIRYDFSQVRR